MRKATIAGLVVVLSGCGAEAVQVPVAPGTPAPVGSTGPAPTATAPAAPPPDPFALPERTAKEAPPAETGTIDFARWTAASKAKGIAPSPAACSAFGKRAAVKPAPKDLVTAMAEADLAKRDAMLLALEGSESDVPAGIVRALRAELAPIECADALTDPWLTKNGNVKNVPVLAGLSLASKLARTAGAAPTLKAGLDDKKKVLEFIKGPLKAWMIEQSKAIDDLSNGGAGLSGYARGVAAIEAGAADLRLVDQMRSAPVPSGWDAELKGVYEASLDEALEPRKVRGRDAALVGLGDFSEAGALHDARTERARALLGKLYGGRKVDALDGLMLPKAPPPSPKSAVEQAAARMPAYYVGLAERPNLPAWQPFADASSRPFELDHALPWSVRETFKKPAPPADLAPAYARARFDVGRMSWRRVDFVEAAYAAKGGDRLLLALAIALSHAQPDNVAAMMKAPSPAVLGLDHTEALDALVTEGGAAAGMAAFDAAYLRAISPPKEGATSASLLDVAARFHKAESLLTDPADKKRAADRAADAEASAKALK